MNKPLFVNREIKSKKLILKCEIELTDSLLTAEEAAERIQFLINIHSARAFEELLRETKSSMWEMKKLEME